MTKTNYAIRTEDTKRRLEDIKNRYGKDSFTYYVACNIFFQGDAKTAIRAAHS